jgi:diguanylate cyclase (GGDEF)-like protein
VSERSGFERDLARLVAACETGLDLPGVLAAAADAAGAALSAGSVSSYALSEQRDGLALLAGDGPQRLELPGLEPVTEDGRTLLPLVSAGRVLGGLLAERVAEPGGLGRARIAAGIAAQAMEASRLWDSVAGESGTLDPLTRLPNQLGFQSVLGRELARAKRTGQSLAVSLVDLDGLADYTARHGAAEADRVLRLAAGGLAGGVRSYDCVCRLDEGEFALVLPGMTAESAAALVGRLASGFGAWSLDGAPVTVSGGVAAFPEHAATNDELVRLASAALGRSGDARVIAWDGAAEGADDPVRSLEARGGRSADSRAVSEYAGHIASACGLEPDHVDRVRLAASLDDPAAAGGEDAERRRLAERVAAGMIDDEAAGWLLARFDPVPEAPLEARVIAVAEAFVAAGGHRSQASAGLALSVLWQQAGERLDAGCVRTLERLLADELETQDEV